MNAKNGLVVALSMALTVTACGRNPAPQPAAPQQEVAARPTSDSDAAARAAREAEEARQRELQRIRGVLGTRVHFDYDDSSIRSDAKRTLDEKLPLLRQDATWQLTIEGHADERGSTEYNVALGMRRAVAVRDYFVGFGLSPQRFQTVSYGEERPLATGSNDGAWSQNRRAEFQAMGGN